MTLVEVDGLLCEQVCVRRVARSLAMLPGVSGVQHIRGTDRFLFHAASEVDETDVNVAVQRVVFLRWLRRMLQRAAGTVGGFLAD